MASTLCKYDLRKGDLFVLHWHGLDGEVSLQSCKCVVEAPKDSLHDVKLSQWYGKPCANCVYPSRTQQWGPNYRFGASRPCGPAGWLSMLLIRAGNVETDPGPTTTRKQVWICDICHRQIQVRKQISIRCNRIEH